MEYFGIVHLVDCLKELLGNDLDLLLTQQALVLLVTINQEVKQIASRYQLCNNKHKIIIMQQLKGPQKQRVRHLLMHLKFLIKVTNKRGLALNLALHDNFDRAPQPRLQVLRLVNLAIRAAADDFF